MTYFIARSTCRISQISGERYQDHWSSGLKLLIFWSRMNTVYWLIAKIRLSQKSEGKRPLTLSVVGMTSLGCLPWTK